MNADPDLTSNTYITALAGAILGLKAIPGVSLAERAGNLLGGFLMAVFMGPAVVDYLHITSARVASGLIFAIGAAGLVAFSAFAEAVRQTPFGAILSSWLSRNRGS